MLSSWTLIVYEIASWNQFIGGVYCFPSFFEKTCLDTIYLRATHTSFDLCRTGVVLTEIRRWRYFSSQWSMGSQSRTRLSDFTLAFTLLPHHSLQLRILRGIRTGKLILSILPVPLGARLSNSRLACVLGTFTRSMRSCCLIPTPSILAPSPMLL